MSERRGNLTIVNQLGLHARAASKFVGLAGKFDAEVWIGIGEREVNGKSILGVLMLACSQGSTIELRCEGVDADKAFEALGKLITSGFGEL
jgi:phosphocarrier protein